MGLGEQLSQEHTEGECGAALSEAGEREKALNISLRSRHVRGSASPRPWRGGQLWAGKMGRRLLPSLRPAYLR